jgi:hypothetical protein
VLCSKNTVTSHFLDDPRIQKQLSFHLYFNDLPLSPRYVTTLYSIPVRLRPSYNSHWSFVERVVSFLRFVGAFFVLSSTRSCFRFFPRSPNDFVSKPSRSFLLVSSRSRTFTVVSCGESHPNRIVVPDFEGALSSFFVVPSDPLNFAYGTISPRHHVPVVSFLSCCIALV